MKEKVLDLLEEVCEDDIVREELDLDLFEEDILDSLGFAELLAKARPSSLFTRVSIWSVVAASVSGRRTASWSRKNCR